MKCSAIATANRRRLPTPGVSPVKEQDADERVVDGEGADVDPEDPWAGRPAVRRRSRPPDVPLQAVVGDEPAQCHQVDILLEVGQHHPGLGDGPVRPPDLRQDVDEDVRDGDAARERENGTPREFVDAR